MNKLIEPYQNLNSMRSDCKSIKRKLSHIIVRMKRYSTNTQPDKRRMLLLESTVLTHEIKELVMKLELWSTGTINFELYEDYPFSNYCKNAGKALTHLLENLDQTRKIIQSVNDTYCRDALPKHSIIDLSCSLKETKSCLENLDSLNSYYCHEAYRAASAL